MGLGGEGGRGGEALMKQGVGQRRVVYRAPEGRPHVTSSLSRVGAAWYDAPCDIKEVGQVAWRHVGESNGGICQKRIFALLRASPPRWKNIRAKRTNESYSNDERNASFPLAPAFVEPFRVCVCRIFFARRRSMGKSGGRGRGGTRCCRRQPGWNLSRRIQTPFLSATCCCR